MSSVVSTSQTKRVFGLFVEQLYDFFFHNEKTAFAIYAITLVIALVYALISDFVLGRPRETVLYEGSILAAIALLCTIVGYNVGTMRAKKSIFLQQPIQAIARNQEQELSKEPGHFARSVQRLVIEKMNEVELVEKIGLGNVLASEELIRRYSRAVRIILSRSSANHEIVADLYHQTFRIALEKIYEGSLQDPKKLGAFIYGIAHNLVIEYFRKTPVAVYRDIEKTEKATDDTSDLDDLLLLKKFRGNIPQIISRLEDARYHHGA